MAEERLIDVYAQIMEHIKNSENFLLSGGAGSGKTYTLVQVIRGLLSEYPSSTIACVTYTNAAVQEIKNRVNNRNLHVSTIHDFLWDCIKNFQNELKKSLPTVINSSDYKTKFRDEEECPEDFFISEDIEKIKYSEHLNIKKGIISHDEVLELAHYMFAHFPKLCDIVRSRFPFILIDEYQDTSKLVIDIVLKNLSPSNLQNNTRQCVIGFFGDAMQSIYDDGIGYLKDYNSDIVTHVHEIQKVQNRRNPQSIIDLANKLRTDGLQQAPSTDSKAPNMENNHIKQGEITFLYSVNEIGYDDVRNYIVDNYNWNFADTANTKELNLTHNMIAGNAGFSTLMEIFNGDKILEYCQLIRKEVDKHPDDTNYETMTLEEVMSFLKDKYENDIINPTSGMADYINSHQDLMEIAKKTSYSKIVKMYVDQDQLIDDKKEEDDDNTVGSKRAPIIKHLFKIQEIIYLYKQNKLGEFLKLTGKNYLLSVNEKKTLKEKMEQLSNTDGLLLGNLIDMAHDLDILTIDDRLQNYIDKYGYVYHRIRKVSYEEFMNYFNYMEGKTPFSTLHKTKGSEYNNVLVLLESKWNKYNFSYLMGETPRRRTSSFANVLNRTKKLFYVCCTRAKNHLIVFYSNPSSVILETAKGWFGDDNIKIIPPNTA